MNYRNTFMQKLNMIKLLLFTVATSFISYGQQNKDDQDIDSLLDELFFNDKELVDDLLNSINQYDFIYTSLIYNSNTFFAGRDSGVDQFNVIPQVSYFSSSGFNAAVTGIYYQNQENKWDFVSLTAGYANTIGKQKNIHYNLGYSRFFYSDSWDEFNNSIDLLLGIRNQKRTLGLVVNGSYLFGTDNSVQISSRIYGNFSLVRESDYAIKFRPQVNFLVAEQVIAYIIPPRNGNLPRVGISEEFNLLNTQLSIPISYTSSTWDVELSWNLNMPSPIANEGSLNSTNFFSLSVGYLFDLRK